VRRAGLLNLLFLIYILGGERAGTRTQDPLIKSCSGTPGEQSRSVSNHVAKALNSIAIQGPVRCAAFQPVSFNQANSLAHMKPKTDFVVWDRQRNKD
jgi:hypothetical protein